MSLLPHDHRSSSFYWEGEIVETDGGYRWEMEIPDEAAARQILPLNLLPMDSYVHAQGENPQPIDWHGIRERSIHALRNNLPYYSQEYRCFNHAGEERWIQEEVSLEPLGPGHWKAQGICIDITERKRTEPALRESDATFLSFIDSPDMMRGIVEVHGDDILHLADNSVAARYFGITTDAMRRRWASELGVSVEARKVWIEHYLESERQGRPVSFEFTYNTETGPRWLWVTVTRIGEGRARFGYIVQDITERKITEAALRESETRFREAMVYAPIGMALVSLDGYFMYANPALCELVGYTEEEFRQLTFQEITHPEDLEVDLSNVHQLIEGAIRNYQIKKRYFHKEGHEVWVLLNVSLVRDEKGRPLYFISQIQDVTRQKRDEEELNRLNEELYQASRQDHLTGLRNRLRLKEDLEDLQGRYERYGRSFCVGMCDLDDFKSYNDLYGHMAGDRALQRVADLILSQERTGDTAYRFGGEEFLLIFPEQSVRKAKVAMERIRRAVEAAAIPHEGKSPGGIMTISGGVAGMTPREKKSVDQLLKEADEAMYRSKQAGKNRISI